MTTWYCYTFEDGYQCWCGKMSAQELGVEKRKHGKLISKIPC